MREHVVVAEGEDEVAGFRGGLQEFGEEPGLGEAVDGVGGGVFCAVGGVGL